MRDVMDSGSIDTSTKLSEQMQRHINDKGIVDSGSTYTSAEQDESTYKREEKRITLNQMLIVM